MMHMVAKPLDANVKRWSRQVLKHINLGDYLSSRVPSLKGCSGQKPNGEVKASSLKLLAHIMQFLQRHEFRLKHDDWMNTVKPNLHPGVSAQLHEKFEVFDAEIENSKSVRSEMRAVINSLLKLGANVILAVSLAV
ncbi:hypothetical protein JHK86_006590 [Glycine max]|nr:hypothetical protein JHK86_006590 [Glycine max]